MSATERITKLDELVFKRHMGVDWDRRKHLSLQFTGNQFYLDSLGDPNNPNNMGILAHRLDRTGVELVDVSSNNLSDIDVISEANKFAKLRTLRARKNKIIDPHLRLPMLVELHLGHNELNRIPNLANLTSLEVLVLPHNYIKGTLDNLQKAEKLKRIDLAYNRFDLRPSAFNRELEHNLKPLSALENLRLKDNPFCGPFPEYQVYCVRAISSLRKLDDQEITTQTREEILQDALRKLDDYDAVYDERSKELESARLFKKAVKGRDLLAEKIRFDALVDEIEGCLTDPDRAVYHAKRLFDLAGKVHHLQPSEWNDLWKGQDERREDSGNRPSAARHSVESFVQSVLLVMERHETVRSVLLRVLAKLAVVGKNGLGAACLTGLGDLVRSHTGLEPEIKEVTRGVIVKAVADNNSIKRLDSDKEDRASHALLMNLAHLCEKNHLGDALQPMVKQLCQVFKESHSKADALLALLAAALLDESNAIVAWGEGVHRLVARHLDSETYLRSEKLQHKYVALLRIAERMARAEDRAARQLADDSVHVKLLNHLRAFLSKDTGGLSLQKAKMTGPCIDCIAALIKHDKTNGALREAVDDRHSLDLFLKGAKDEGLDPVVLSASLRAILVVLEKRSEKAQEVAEGLNKLRQLMHFLGLTKYKVLWEHAENHVKLDARDARGMEDETVGLPRASADKAGTTKAPELGQQTNHYVHSVFLAIVNLIGWFAANKSIPICAAVNQSLNEEQRETVLFRLLATPSDEIRNAIMECMDRIDTAELETEEMAQLIKLLEEQVNIGAGETEKVLSKVISLLTKLAMDNETEAGRVFRNDHGEAAVEEVADVLYRNALRRTNDDQEEENQKTELSFACVWFLRQSSLRTDFRKFLRSKRLSEQFRVVLKKEEQLHSPTNPDVLLELTWLGRDADVLTQALTAADRLHPRKKQAFRLVARLGDILMGRSDAWDTWKTAEGEGRGKTREDPILLEEICAREDQMWNLRGMKRESDYLDVQEERERVIAQEQFVALSGIERLAQVMNAPNLRSQHDGLDEKGGLMRPSAEDRERVREDSDTFTGRLKTFMEKADKETKEKYTKEKEKTEHDKVTGRVEEDPFENVSGRDLLMRTLMAPSSDHPGGSSDSGGSLFGRPTADFLDTPFKAPLSDGTLDAAYIVSAYLRCLYCSVELSVSEEIRQKASEHVTRPHVIRRLRDLVRLCPFAQCNVGAKFLRLMTAAITLGPKDTAASIDHIRIYDMICELVQEVVHPLRILLSRGQAELLSGRQLTLCAELASFFAIVAQQTGYVCFSQFPEVQKLCIERAMPRLMPESAVKVLVAMIIYELQLDAGSSHGTVIAHLLEHSAQRQGIREQAMKAVAALVQRCPSKKYEVLESFCKAKVLNKTFLRISFLQDFLHAILWKHYTESLQMLLTNLEDASSGSVLVGLPIHGGSKGQHREVHRPKTLPVRVLGAYRVKLYIWKKKMWENRVLVLAHHRLVWVIQPRGTHCSVCPEDRFCPTPPTVEGKGREYETMTRLVRGFGPQMLAVGWIKEDEKGGGTGNEKEEVDIIVCEHLGDREALLRALQVKSGSDVEHRVPLYNDGELLEIVRQKVDGEPVCATCAVETGSKSPYMTLFVLTFEKVFEMSVNMQYWFIPRYGAAEKVIEQEGILRYADDVQKNELKKYNKYLRVPPIMKQTRTDTYGMTRTVYSSFLGPTPAKLRNIRELEAKRNNAIENSLKKADVGLLEKVKAFVSGGTASVSVQELYQEKVKEAQRHLFRTIVQQELTNLKKVTFSATADPSVTMDFGLWGRGEMKITLFDDASRELWRRNLAFVLNQEEGAARWKKKWEGKLEEAEQN